MTQPQPSPPARLLWDQGGLWSLMAWRALRAAGLAVSPITAAEVAGGGLAGARLLMVPGGWPALKAAALGEVGAQAVRDFVAAGGAYLGLCGGAGLALTVPEGLGLLPLGRAQGARRLPSASGPIWVDLAEAPPPGPWEGLPTPALFHIWFPGQFAPTPAGVTVLARYGAPGPGLCTADLVVDQVDQDDWPDLEEGYGLNLDPSGLAGQAAVLAGAHGAGRVWLSYLHFDTPGDQAGARVLVNLWRASGALAGLPAPAQSLDKTIGWGPAAGLATEADRLWASGEAAGLWQPRHPAMPLWRRASRGLEFWSLVSLCHGLADLAALAPDAAQDTARRLEPLLTPIWQEGPGVIAAQAALLAGDITSQEAPPASQAWFPAPRRSGGALQTALLALEDGLLSLLRAAESD